MYFTKTEMVACTELTVRRLNGSMEPNFGLGTASCIGITEQQLNGDMAAKSGGSKANDFVKMVH